MSNLSLLFTSNAQALTPAAREIRNAQCETRIAEGDFNFSSRCGEVEQALPSGIHSLDHWLDLNG